MSRDAGFTSLYRSVAAPRGQDGRTSVTIPIVGRQLGEFFWRVRAVSGEAIGTPSAARSFMILADGLGTPVLIEPASGSQLSAPPRLRLQTLTHEGDWQVVRWTYRFEVARDPGFASVVVDSTIAENPTPFLALSLDAGLAPGQYYWRAQGIDATGTRGPTSAAWAFSIGAPFVNVPALISPADGETVNQRPTFTIGHAPHSGGPAAVEYELALALDAAFTSPLPSAVGQSAEIVTLPNMTARVLRTDLAPRTYYWRARMVVRESATIPALMSAWTPARAVVLAGTPLSAPEVPTRARVPEHGRPTLTVNNSVRNGPVGPIVYRFEVASDASFSDWSRVAAGTAAEAPGQTSWTVPAQLPVNATYYWRAVAADTSSGTTSVPSWTSSFTVVPAAQRIYALTITLPSSCSGERRSGVFLGTSADTPGSRFQFRTMNETPQIPQEIAIDLAPGSGDLSGTIGGSALSDGDQFQISQAAGSTVPAGLAGRVGSDGSVSGTFAGHVRANRGTHWSFSCTAPDIGWRLAPR